jgi:hypothetical protein
MLSLSHIKASKHEPSVNAIFTISIQPELASEARMRIKSRHRCPPKTLPKAEELEASMDHGTPTLQSGSQQSS